MSDMARVSTSPKMHHKSPAPQDNKRTLIARFMESTWGPLWDRQDPGGPHVGPMNFAITEVLFFNILLKFKYLSNVDYYLTISPNAL